ncbi:hypothetical protein EDD11_005097 [Mortierella claussenii]|nr:hypothetical protein EDD11_005097 [Mortierella claussenii]
MRARSNTSTVDCEEIFSDRDSIHNITASPSHNQQSSHATPSGEHPAAPKKSRTSGLRLSLRSLRLPKPVAHIPTDSEHSPDTYSECPSTEDARVHLSLENLQDPHFQEGRAFHDGIDPRRRDQPASPPQLCISAPKTSTRFSFIHSPTPATPAMARPSHHRSYTTPTNSYNAYNYGTPPRRPMVSPSPKPVKETHTMLKDYDPMTGNKMINKYMVVRELGRGVHGKVKLCRDTETDEFCAIKIVDRTTRRRLGRAQISNEQKIRREIAIMKKCIHPNVVRLIEVIDDPTARKIYLVLEYMEGGEVRWKDVDDKPILPLNDARAVFRDVVLGLEYLHMQGIIHRDIKPANLLLSGEGTAKISDFGVSHFSEKNLLEHDLKTSPAVEKALPLHTSSNPFESFFRDPTVPTSFTGRQPPSPAAQHHQWDDDLELAKTAGSPAFFAPELCYASELSPAMSPALSSASQTSFILSSSTPRTNPSTPIGTFAAESGQGYGSRPPITKAIDIWALGVTLYCFVYGRCPFIAETEFELFNIIPRKCPTYHDSVPGRDFISAPLKDLLARLLEKDVCKRITLKEVKEHPWVTEGLSDPERWRTETDPSNYQQIHVTDEDLKGAVTIMDKIKSRIRRLSVSLSNFTRRRSGSITSTHTPGSPSGPRSPIPIIRSPVATTSQSITHAVAQPHTFVSPMSLPERFQYFHSFSHSGSAMSQGQRRPDFLERPNSAYSNSSSIEELDEDEDQSGSGFSAHASMNYAGRRRIFRSTGSQGDYSQSLSNSDSKSSSSSRPLSAASFPSVVSSRRNDSDDHLDQTHHGSGPYVNNRHLVGGVSFNGAVSARAVSSGHSNLSKSWVYLASTDAESGGCHSQKHQESTHLQQKGRKEIPLDLDTQQTQLLKPSTQGLSHIVATLSPSSTLVPDSLREQGDYGYLTGSGESLPKDSAARAPSMAPQDLAIS